MFIPTGGLRRGEITVRWHSVDLDRGQLAVVASTEQLARKGNCREKETKGTRNRTIALSAQVVAELRAHKATAGGRAATARCHATAGLARCREGGWHTDTAPVPDARMGETPGGSRPQADQAAQHPAQPRLAHAGEQRASEDRPRAPGAQLDCDHDGHILARNAQHAARRGCPG
jgi:integrase